MGVYFSSDKEYFHSINPIPGWPGSPLSPFLPAGPSKPGSPSLPGSPGSPMGPRTHKNRNEVKGFEVSKLSVAHLLLLSDTQEEKSPLKQI